MKISIFLAIALCSGAIYQFPFRKFIATAVHCSESTKRKKCKSHHCAVCTIVLVGLWIFYLQDSNVVLIPSWIEHAQRKILCFENWYNARNFWTIKSFSIWNVRSISIANGELGIDNGFSKSVPTFCHLFMSINNMLTSSMKDS